MKECLHCSKGFEPKKPTRKFCSDSCRVMYNRKHGKKGEIKPFQMQVMYNQIMEAVAKINESKSLPEPIGFIAEQSKHKRTYPSSVTILRSAEQWQALKRSCESEDEWYEVKEQILEADNLTPKQKQLIINTP